jgi:hypothetical protein
MIRRGSEYIAVCFFFILCQVIGTMCFVPDVSMAQDIPALTEEGLACPMDGTTMCPPSITPSPERQGKHIVAANIFYVPLLICDAVVAAVPSNKTQWTWSSAYSLVPISITSPSVLRI